MRAAVHPKLLLPALWLAALLAFPVAAQATLAYVNDPHSPHVYVANDDGSNSHAIEAGQFPYVSPDGTAVAFQHPNSFDMDPQLSVSSVSGEGLASTFGWMEKSELAWSPDSTTIALVLGSYASSNQELILFDVGSNSRTDVAGGSFAGLSFSPDGSQLVYSMNGDLYRLAVNGGKPVRLTHGGNPLWGPHGRIVFTKQVGQGLVRHSELFLTNPAGRHVRRLTHTTTKPLELGLFPTEWSADGKRLLAEFHGYELSYAVAVNPRNGAQRPIADPLEAFIGTDLSANGKVVLGYRIGFFGADAAVETVPYKGGKPTVLIKNGFESHWTR
jgi:hypothetical protein